MCVIRYNRKRKRARKRISMYTNPKHDFVAPYRSVGLVISNGKISNEMINGAFTNYTPYYGFADGVYRDQLGKVGRGEIVWQSTDLRQSISASSCSSDPYIVGQENSTMSGLTVVNGQGDSNLSNHDFMNTIQIMGVVEMDNGDSRERFNIVSDGIMDVKNNGNETITVGDPVIAYAPSHEELGKGSGNNPSNAEKSGRYVLWYKPFKAGLHTMTTKGIYTCLKDVANTKGYLPAYRRMCHQFIDSVAGMTMVIIARMMPQLRMLLNDETKSDGETLVNILTLIGHSDFKSMPGYDNETRMAIIDSLFVPFSTNSRNAVEYIFPPNPEGQSKREKEMMRRVNEVQQKSTSQFMESESYWLKNLDNLIIGQAKSTARPGMDFSLKIRK